MKTQSITLVAIGGNLPAEDGTPALELCRRSVRSIDGVAGLRLTGVSDWYATDPIPASGQPPYINAVARLTGEAEPEALLAALQAIERHYGRTRSAPNAARTLDLDIIAMEDIVRDAPDPVLPHPRMHQRAFVLQPLLDVAPGWIHPALHRSAEQLLAALPPQGIRRLVSSHLREDGKTPN